MRGMNMIDILLILAEAFFISPKKEPTSIGLTFLKCICTCAHHACFDTKHGEDEEQEKFSETFMHTIQFCWSTANKLLPPISYCILESLLTTNWSNFLDRNAILPHTFDQAIDLTGRKDKIMETLETIRYDLAYIKGQAEGKAARSEKEESKKGFKCLPKHVQLMVLKASSSDGIDATSAPTEMFIEFLEQKNAGDAKGYLQYQLECIKVSNFIPCQLLVSALHKGFFF